MIRAAIVFLALPFVLRLYKYKHVFMVEAHLLNSKQGKPNQ